MSVSTLWLIHKALPPSQILTGGILSFFHLPNWIMTFFSWTVASLLNPQEVCSQWTKVRMSWEGQHHLRSDTCFHALQKCQLSCLLSCKEDLITRIWTSWHIAVIFRSWAQIPDGPLEIWPSKCSPDLRMSCPHDNPEHQLLRKCACVSVRVYAHVCACMCAQ